MPILSFFGVFGEDRSFSSSGAKTGNLALWGVLNAAGTKCPKTLLWVDGDRKKLLYRGGGGEIFKIFWRR